MLCVVAGDDLSIVVEFEGDLPDFENGDSAIFIAHGSEDMEYSPYEYGDNTATFVFSGEDTKELYSVSCGGELEYCIRVNFSDGSQFTPIHRAFMLLEEC